MAAQRKQYVCIDLKSFYASVECVERGLNPMTAYLVVADKSRTEKTICLAVSPSLKKYGIPGRARLFEVEQRLKELNAYRRRFLSEQEYAGKAYDAEALQDELEVDYIAAPPRMALYMEYSARIYQIYMRYVAPEDIHVYSVDEVFMDVTPYLKLHHMSARELTKRMILQVLKETGLTAAAGIGTNLYLSKVAMDIEAKHVQADADGVRIAQLDEESYRYQLWNHRPLTDFWRVGRGYAKKLESCGLYTMGDIARCSLGKPEEYHNEELLYRLFGVNAELLIDHAWGWEPCTIAQIKAYRPQENSISSGQVLSCPYEADGAGLIIREMTDALALELVEKRLTTDQLTLTIGYDVENLKDLARRKAYKGKIVTDVYGRQIPEHAHGSIRLERTSSARKLTGAMTDLFQRIIDPSLLVRRITITACRVERETSVQPRPVAEQMDLFTDYEEKEREREQETKFLNKERKLQEAVLGLKKKYGKNAVLKGMNLEKGATARERNAQIGGHKA